MVALEIWNFLHFIGLALGLGGATIANIISRKADNDKELSRGLHKILPPIIKLIWTGLILLIISGIALPYYITYPMNKQILIIKHVIVVWIVLIGIFIGIISKRVMTSTPIGKEKPKQEFLKISKIMKVLSTINLILWYVVTLLSAFI